MDKQIAAKWKLFVLYSLIPVAVCAGSVVYLVTRPYRAPDIARIREIEAVLFDVAKRENEDRADGETETVFRIPAENWSRLLAQLDGSQRDWTARKWKGIAQITIKTSGPEIPVSLYHTGERKGAFSVGKNYFRGSSDDELLAILQDSLARNEAALVGQGD